jgi:hypothetical protein
MCTKDRTGTAPIGIGLPVATKTAALMIRDNHKRTVPRAG